ncbi:hypothetical protein BsWGS_21486 [Bradybaena similaris]
MKYTLPCDELFSTNSAIVCHNKLHLTALHSPLPTLTKNQCLWYHHCTIHLQEPLQAEGKTNHTPDVIREIYVMSWIWRALTVVTFCLLEAEAYQFNKHSSTTDFVIGSPNYPKSYPTNLNVTWELDVPSGKWGVVFTDFDLDVGSESHDSRDWLEIVDRGGQRVIYSVDMPPLLPYISDGPWLTIQFVSDGIRDASKRGFQLQVLYGANEREVHMKIHEASKTKKAPQEEDFSLALIITTSILAFVAFVVIIIVVVLIRKNAQNNRSENRNAFGIRRNSGISHSRRTRSTDEAPPSDGQAQQQQQQQQQQQPQQQHQQQQQHRPERIVQRSNSQLNWMARAELTTTLQKTASSRPNAYTSTVVVKAAAGAATHTVGNSCRATSNNTNMERSFDSGLDEYSETVDCLNHTPETSQTMQEVDYDNQQPPSYEESYLVSEALQTSGKQQPGLSHCYENFASNVCTALQHLGNETNIYINTIGNSGSRGSVNEITIGASNCIIKAKCGDTLEDKSPINKSAINLDAPATNIVIYQNLPNKQSANIRPSSSSSIQIIDGYAFIVPSSALTGSSISAPQLPAVGNGLETETLGNSTHSQNATPDIGEAVQVPLQQTSTGAYNDIYINTQHM